MKISKSLLQAIVVGITLGVTTSSCDSIKQQNDDLQLQDCSGENCTQEHTNPEPEPYPCCPACGRG